MISSTGPKPVVVAPPLVQSPTGLIQAAVVIDEKDPAVFAPFQSADRVPDHLFNGIKYAPESAYQPIVLQSCPPFGSGTASPVDDTTNNARHLGTRLHQPYWIETMDTCSAFGWRAVDYEGRALRAIEAKESTILERYFEGGGDLAAAPIASTSAWYSEPHLAGGNVYYLDGATTSGGFVVTSTFWNDNDIGKKVTGTGIGTAAVVQSVIVGVSATLTVASTATGSAIVLTVTSPYFVQLNTAATPVSVSIGFALLQEAIAEANVGRGMIHVSSFLAERAAENHAMRFNVDATGDTALTSANGNLVVAGNGYRGIGPDKPATGGTIGAYPITGQTGQSLAGTPVQWAYATDMVQVVRASEPTITPDPAGPGWDRAISDAMNNQTNTITIRSYRPHVIEWAGLCHAAVAISALA